MTAEKRGVTRDQQLIFSLLCGRIAGKKHHYLKEGSTEEMEARRALARLLRTSQRLDLGLRFLIGNMIDPDCREAERRIRFVYRRKGKRSNALLEKEIATHILARVQAGTKTESAIEDAMKKFNLKRSRIFQIWMHWQPLLERRAILEWPKRKI